MAGFLEEVQKETNEARAKHGPHRSLHQSYGLLCEEVAEFFDEVRLKSENRNPEAVLRELIQVASVCQKAAEDLGFID